MQYKANILTGIRPTGNLTIANYLGAIRPIVELQNQQMLNPDEKKGDMLLFVADLHALTDNDSAFVKKFRYDIIVDCLALGIDTKRTKIFLQSSIGGELTMLATILAKHLTVAELLRIPTLKDKIKVNSKPETANTLLFLYPLLMAADILIQGAHYIPVGEDQLPHIELTRDVARKFNKTYGEVFPLPEPLMGKAISINSLKGDGKMSKGYPEGAIFLTDSLDVIASKIKKAETAIEGTMNKTLESHIFIAKSLCQSESEVAALGNIIEEHKGGKPVMGQFKEMLTQVVQRFVSGFQARKASLIKDPSLIYSVLQDGTAFAKSNAQETMQLVEKTLFG